MFCFAFRLLVNCSPAGVELCLTRKPVVSCVSGEEWKAFLRQKRVRSRHQVAATKSVKPQRPTNTAGWAAKARSRFVSRLSPCAKRSIEPSPVALAIRTAEPADPRASSDAGRRPICLARPQEGFRGEKRTFHSCFHSVRVRLKKKHTPVRYTCMCRSIRAVPASDPSKRHRLFTQQTQSAALDTAVRERQAEKATKEQRRPVEHLIRYASCLSPSLSVSPSKPDR